MGKAPIQREHSKNVQSSFGFIDTLKNFNAPTLRQKGFKMVNMDTAAKRGNGGYKMQNTKIIKKERKPKEIRELTRKEEIIHAITHGIPALLSILGLILLILKAIESGAVAVVGASIYGASLIILYSASCLYHSSCIKYRSLEEGALRRVCQKIDHSMIFILILGTYTPAYLTSLGGWVGWTIFGIVAFCSVLGMTLNFISVKKFEKFALALNLISGWMIVIAAIPFYNAIGQVGFNYLVAGGLFYTIGVIFYKLQNIPYMHVIWHIFVIAGSLMHYVMVYNFIY